VASTLDDFGSARPHRIDGTRARRKNPAVEDGIAATPDGGLKIGAEVLAVIKSTDVMIARP
jgi:hypothetical protein